VNSLADDVAYIEGQVEALWGELAVVTESTVSLPCQALCDLPVALRTRVLRKAAEHFLGSTSRLGWTHIESLSRLIDGGRTGNVHLPDGLTAEVSSDLISFALDESLKVSGPLPETKLAVPGETEILGWRIETRIADAAEVDFSDDQFVAWLDFDAVGEELYVRSRRDGDRFRPLGLSNEKKLQDFFVDGKVPRRERDAVPLVCAPLGIAWVVGHRLDDRAKVTPSTNIAICIKFIRKY
jgi:tRNA(Ile)-lysidine synthase